MVSIFLIVVDIEIFIVAAIVVSFCCGGSGCCRSRTGYVLLTVSSLPFDSIRNCILCHLSTLKTKRAIVADFLYTLS